MVAAAICLYLLACTKLVTRDPLSTDTGVQAILEMSAVSLSLLLSVIAVTKYVDPPRPGPTLLLGLAFCLVTGISSINSYWPAFSVVKTLMYAAPLVLVATWLQVTPPPCILRTYIVSVTGLCAAGILLTSLGMFGVNLFSTNPYTGRIRLQLFATHPGVTAEQIALALLVMPACKPIPSRILRLFLWAVLFLTGARVATIMAILLVVMVRRTVPSRKAIVLSILSGFVILGLLPFAASSERLSGVSSMWADAVKYTSSDMTTLGGRDLVWSHSFALIFEHPWIGYGFDGYRPLLLSVFAWAGESHNSFMDIVLSGGFIGLGLFLLMWAAALFNLLRMPRGPLSIVGWRVNAFLLAVSLIGRGTSAYLAVGPLLLGLFGQVTVSRRKVSYSVAVRKTYISRTTVAQAAASAVVQ